MSITPIPLPMKMEVLARDGWDCLCCGRPTRRHPDGKVYADTLSFDHVLPEKHGGLTTADNLQVLCMACNLHKGVDTIDLRKIAQSHRRMQNDPKWDRDYLQRPRRDGLPVWRSNTLTPGTWLRSADESLESYLKRPSSQRARVDYYSREIWCWVPFKEEVRRMPSCPVRERELANRAEAERMIRSGSLTWLRQQSA